MLSSTSAGVFSDRMVSVLDEMLPRILSTPGHGSALLKTTEVLALPTSRGY